MVAKRLERNETAVIRHQILRPNEEVRLDFVAYLKGYHFFLHLA